MSSTRSAQRHVLQSVADDHGQFLTVNDRKESRLILSPTHEEEITTLVANNSKSYKDFPLRLFQIGTQIWSNFAIMSDTFQVASIETNYDLDVACFVPKNSS